MPARRDTTGKKPQWRYRKVVILPGGRKERIGGTPKINTKVAAEAAERAHVERVLRSIGMAAAPTLKDFAEKFLTVYAVKNKPSEQASKRWILDRHLLPYFGKMTLDTITELAILEFRAGLVRSDLTAKTANNVVTVLTKLLRWAEKIEVLPRHSAPTPGMLKLPPQEADFLEFEEYDRLRAAPDPFHRAAVMVAGDAGLRRGEIIGVRWSGDVDMRARRITVHQSVWDGHVTTPKGGRPRTIPMTDRLYEALKEIRGIRERVFVREDGRTWTKEVMRWALPKALEATGVRAIGWHTLRHTFCSHLAIKGATVKEIQEWAGHADLKTTLRYMHLSPQSAASIHLLERPISWQVGGKSESGEDK